MTFNKLNEEQSNLVVLKILCILEDAKYRKIYNWPFDDITIDDLYKQIKKVHSNNSLSENFIKFCLNHIEKKKQYSVIEGFFNLILLFEEQEGYEQCIVLKNIKDQILIDLHHT